MQFLQDGFDFGLLVGTVCCASTAGAMNNILPISKRPKLSRNVRKERRIMPQPRTPVRNPSMLTILRPSKPN
jgi:hypothetical protein